MLKNALSNLSFLNFEPLLTTAIGFNIAYIGLQRFRYRSAIRNYVAKSLKQNNIPDEKTAKKETPALLDSDRYLHLIRLANLSENRDIRWWNIWKKIRKPPVVPSIGVIVYRALFALHLDTAIAIFGILYSTALLIVATGQEYYVLPKDSLHITTMFGLFAEPNFELALTAYQYNYIAAVIFVLFPPFAIFCGHYSVKQTIKSSNRHLNKLLQDMRAGAQVATLNGNLNSSSSSPSSED